MPEFQEKLAPTVSLVTTIPTKETLMDVTPKKVVEPPHTASNGKCGYFFLKLYIFYVKNTHTYLLICSNKVIVDAKNEKLCSCYFFSAIFK